MSELAYNANGDFFDVPDGVTEWRVRRMRPSRGAPELVYGPDGRPLTVSVDATMDELRHAVRGALGRYRLDPVGADGKVLEGVPPAYVQVVATGTTPEPAPPDEDDDHAVIRDAMRLNVELAKSVVDRFPEMMHAAAELVRAADGAGLPARLPMGLREDDPDEDENDDEHDDGEGADARSSLLDLVQPIVGPAVQYLVTGFLSGKLELPTQLAQLFDWRKAAAQGSARRTDSSTASVGNENAPASDQAPARPPAVPKTKLQNAAHFAAIQEALGPADAELARRAASKLPREQIEAWFAELGQLSVADAVAKIRAAIADAQTNGGGW